MRWDRDVAVNPPINKRLKALSLAAPVTKSFFIRQLFILGTGLAVNYGGHFFHWAASLTRLIVFTFLPFKADSFLKIPVTFGQL